MRVLLVLLMLTACANPGRRYVGPLVPDAPSAQCRPATATLTLRGDSAAFNPDEGALYLSGLVEDNRLQAERPTRGPGGTTLTASVDARWDANGATATYVTPRCKYRAQMTPR